MLLEEMFKGINKQFKKELATKGIREMILKRIPFTSPRLNYETYGGIPRGRISMFAGKESSGKTTTALDILKNAQQTFGKEWEEEMISLEEQLNNPKLKKSELDELQEKYKELDKRGPLKCVYFDAEGTIDPQWAEKLGVDIDNVYLVRLHTQTAEQFLDQVMNVCANTNDVGLVVIDSIAVLVPQLTHGESLEQKSMGGNAKVVTDFCNQICPILGEKDIACIIINQARDDFSNPYADFKIPCGNGLKLASSLILTFQKGKLLDENGNEQKQSYDRPQGNLVWVRIQKTKICKPDRRVGFYTLSYDYGVDVVADLLPIAVEYDIIKKGGSWYRLMDPNTGEILSDENGEPLKFQGAYNVMDYLRNNAEVFNMIYDFINRKAIGDTTQEGLDIDSETDRQAIQDCNLPEDMVVRQVSNEIQVTTVES